MLDKMVKCVFVPCPLLILTLMLSAIVAGPLAADPGSASSAQNTRLMQQMDHQRRIDEQRQEAGRVQASSLAFPDEAASEFDYVVVVGLAASAAGIIIVSIAKRKGRPRSARRVPPYQPLR
jgi:hypothetical protein